MYEPLGFFFKKNKIMSVLYKAIVISTNFNFPTSLLPVLKLQYTVSFKDLYLSLHHIECVKLSDTVGYVF